ncbi:arrestin domain-containing protein 3-like [Macrosteles quadrilineatus]|uniref:arrestin domain-containing protein 3-like n=1 Tax=Macrosteles quadrilineatus TaxID=74068 RepID=UPI0023E092D3|nr:arrestin domain-containing protein 3-like [Macrosteles quadrilineatus]
MKRYDLILDEPDRVYFSGDDVKGHVAVCLDTNLTVQGITIRLIGEACIAVPDNFKTTRTVGRRKPFNNKISPSPAVHGERPPRRLGQTNTLFRQDKVYRFSATERYFHFKEYLFGHKYSSFKEQLWKGSHTFPFQYKLPAQLPSSFNGRFGFIRYYCESSLERWQSKDTKRVYFSVSSFTDINNVSKADCSSADEKCTNSCFFCVPRGTIIASCEIKHRGFACGETANITVDIHNMSNNDVIKTTASIIQTVTYSCSQNLRHQENERTVLSHEMNAVPQGESEHTVVKLKIPPLPPSSISQDICKLIQIHYRFEIGMDMHEAKERLVLQMPLVVGNIPLRKNFENLENESIYKYEKQFFIPFRLHKQRGLPQVWSEPSEVPEAEECVYECNDFHPAYPYYREKSKPILPKETNV